MGQRVMEKLFSELFEKLAGIDFALIGTANIKLQGGRISFNDIDFITDDENIEKISEIFGCKISNENGYKECGTVLNNLNVHFVSCSTNPLRNDNLDNKIVISKWGHDIPCMSLQSELDFYNKIDTEKAKNKVTIIKELLSKKI